MADVLGSILHQMQSENAKRFRTPSSSKMWYNTSSRKKFKPPAYHTKSSGLVNPKTSKGSTKDGGGSNILGNLFKDVKTSVVGMPGGIVQTIEHPIATAEAVGKDYARRYSPLIHGDFGKFAHEVQQHPLAPLLDAATVLTAGGGAAAKIGQTGRIASEAAAAEGAGNVAERAAIAAKAPIRSKMFNATKGGERMIGADKKATAAQKHISVPLHHNPVKRLRTSLGIKLQETVIPGKTPLVGLESRARKAGRLQQISEEGRRHAPADAVDHAVRQMEKVAGKDTNKFNAMATALDHIVSGTDPAKIARGIKNNRSNPRWRELTKEHRNMTEEDLQAIDTGIHARLTDTHANELYHAVKRHYQLEALKSGQEIHPMYLQKHVDEKLMKSPEVRAIVAARDAHERAANHAAEMMVDSGQLTKDEVSKRAVLHVNLEREMRGKKERTPEQINEQFAKAGLPMPQYNPDTLTFRDAASPKAMKSDTTGALYKRGERVTNPRNIILRHAMASKATDAKMAHNLMLSMAKHVSGSNIPKDWVWIRDTLEPSLDAKKDMASATMQDGVKMRDDFYSTLASEKRPQGGMAMPKALHDELAAGRQAMTQARSGAVTKGMTAWKYATLATRPGFLVTNVLSNQLMFHLKNGWNFPAMLRANVGKGAFDKYHSAAGATWADSEHLAGKMKTSKLKSAAHIMYTATGWHEHQLRKLTFYETARKMPAVQREIRRLKGGKTLSGEELFTKAYEAAVEKNPHILGLVERNMDDTLGNYRFYTAAEQRLKQLSPFYGWERHSVRNLVRMIEDNPATMAILMEMGVQGDKRFKRDFGTKMPEFVKSFIQDKYIGEVANALGMSHKVNMYDFTSVNPWKTAVDTAQAAMGDPTSLVGAAGPLITAPLEAITGKSALTGAPLPGKAKSMDSWLKGGTLSNNIIEQTIERTIKNTPPAQLLANLSTTKNEDKKMLPESDAQVAFRYGGLSFRNLDKKKAEALKARQDNKSSSPYYKKRKRKSGFKPPTYTP